MTKRIPRHAGSMILYGTGKNGKITITHADGTQTTELPPRGQALREIIYKGYGIPLP